MEKLRQAIQKIISALPDKERYAEVRFHLRQAIKKLKDSPKPITETYKNMAKTTKVAPIAKIAEATTFQKIMNQFDAMIEVEKKKIEEIQKRKEKEEETEEFFND